MAGPAVEALHDRSPARDVDHALTSLTAPGRPGTTRTTTPPRSGSTTAAPTERAALQRLNKLVTRLTRSSADDPELAAVKRDITACLDRIHTVSVSWADIAALPALDQQLIPQLPTGAA